MVVMVRKPVCPDCGGTIGALVGYNTIKVRNLVLSNKGEWQAGSKVLKSYPMEQSDAADVRPVCLSCPWAGVGDVCQLDSPSKGVRK